MTGLDNNNSIPAIMGIITVSIHRSVSIWTVMESLNQ